MRVRRGPIAGWGTGSCRGFPGILCQPMPVPLPPGRKQGRPGGEPLAQDIRHLRGQAKVSWEVSPWISVWVKGIHGQAWAWLCDTAET